MRKIKFRGKNQEGKWLIGDLRHHKDEVLIFLQDANHGERVIDDTVGQFSGHKDFNDVEIFEGDILEELDGTRYLVVWDSEAEGLYLQYHMQGGVTYETLSTFLDMENVALKVIGNIHDNPDKFPK